jgi:hypothetical protein
MLAPSRDGRALGGSMRRTFALLTAIGLVAAAMLALGGTTAGATGTVNVTPSTNLASGTTVTVSWTGLQPFGTPSIVQCKNAPATGASGADCEFLTLQVAADASNASGAGSDTFVVRDSNALVAMNPRTEVRCDTATSGSILVVDNPNDPTSGSFKTITCSGSSTITPPVNVLLSCTGLRQIAALSPAMGSSSAKYVKASGKKSVGDRHEFGTNTTIPADATACDVGTGIRNNNPATDVGTKTNPFDDQTNGHQSLTTTGGKVTLQLAGSATCQTEPQGTVNGSYPTAYPLQGKLAVTFDQTDAKGKPIVLQAYARLGHDVSDPDPTHWVLGGTVIKGPGVGGELSATVRMTPTTSTKNLNPGECTDSDVTDDANNASLTEVAFTLADGGDQDNLVDPLQVTLPA